MAEAVMDIGHPDGLRLRIEWCGATGARTAAQWTRGRAFLWVAGMSVWGQPEAGPAGAFEWTWIELLDFLSQAWSYLEWEQEYPLGLQPIWPSQLRASAEARWHEQTEDRAIEEESVLFAFEECHDLSRALQGAVAASVLLIREGDLMWVAAQKPAVMRPVGEVLDQLTAIGAAIVDRLTACADPRARVAIDDWARRAARSTAEIAEIALGIPADMLRRYVDALPGEPPFASAGAPFELTELRAAARLMAGTLAPEHVAAALAAIADVPPVLTPALDQLSREARERIDSFHPRRPAEEGYDLANWLRRRRGLAESARIDPESLLRELGVIVREITIDDARLDALACWGPRHGPAVILNRAGKHVQQAHGRRTTWAHELCHLIYDRAGALPLAEVFNGRAPRRVEARARAFAAELLLPRRQAELAMDRSSDVQAAVETLSRDYEVSVELVAWQIRNSGAALSAEQLAILKPMVSDPDRF